MVNAVADGGGGTTTSPIFLAGLIGGITDALAAAAVAGQVVIDVDTMIQVRKTLGEARDLLVEASGEMNAIPAGSVGGSPVGAQLKKHASLAHDRLLETITEMETGLANYETAMETYQKDFTTTEDSVTTDVKSVNTNLDSGSTCTGDGSTTTPLPQCQA